MRETRFTGGKPGRLPTRQIYRPTQNMAEPLEAELSQAAEGPLGD